MNKIVSLLSGFSIHCIMEGRVSLAHLMEFSNFVDLYVLEDTIYFDDSEIDIFFEHFKKLENFPFSSIPENDLAFVASRISDRTRSIYDHAPKSFTFSFNSYDYWTSLTHREKGQISEKYPAHLSKNREKLLYESKQLETNFYDLFEEVGKTNYGLMPSTRNILPFLDSFQKIETPIQKMYAKISSAHKEIIDKVYEFNRPQVVYIPPLLSILLSRCSKREEIPYRLSQLREEFADLRKEVTYWFTELNKNNTLKDKLEISEELDNAFNKNTKNYKETQKGFYKNVSGAFLSAFEDGDLKDIVSKPVIALAKEGANILPEVFKSKKFTGIIRLFDASLIIRNYEGLLNNVFSSDLDISQKEISNSRKYYRFIQDTYKIKLYGPN